MSSTQDSVEHLPNNFDLNEWIPDCYRMNNVLKVAKVHSHDLRALWSKVNKAHVWGIKCLNEEDTKLTATIFHHVNQTEGVSEGGADGARRAGRE